MELDELGIDIEAQNCLDQIQQESRTSADYNPSKSMKEEKQYNLCDNLHSPIQTRDEEIKCLVAKISEMTEKMSMILFRQQATMIGTRRSASWMLSF